MKYVSMKVVLAAFILCGTAAAARTVAQVAEAPLTNASVIKLVRAGFSEKTVIAIIRARPARFDLAPERLIELKKSGVGEKVILSMLAREESDVFAGQDMDDDAFFGGGGDGAAPGQKRGSDPGETSIFG
ncbi:MAG: hypothetical protein WCD76_18710, partial [Pyrinomonadaceae bacterium]